MLCFNTLILIGDAQNKIKTLRGEITLTLRLSICEGKCKISQRNRYS
jgi:hypothetical protein